MWLEWTAGCETELSKAGTSGSLLAVPVMKKRGRDTTVPTRREDDVSPSLAQCLSAIPYGVREMADRHF
jgi:hypothetical protein